VRAWLHGEQFRKAERPASSLAWLIAIAKINLGKYFSDIYKLSIALLTDLI